MLKEEFDARTDQILRQLTSAPYAATISCIDALDRAMLGDPHQRDANVSCAALRLDAALLTRQPLEECERLYLAFVALGVDEHAQLQTSIMFANEAMSQRAYVTGTHVAAALERAQLVSSADALVAHAAQLVAEIRAPTGSQLATLGGDNLCRPLATALIEMKLVPEEPARLKSLDLGFPDGCRWTLHQLGRVVSITLVPAVSRWSLRIEPSTEVRPLSVSRHAPSPADSVKLAQRIYQLACDIHAALEPLCHDIAWISIGEYGRPSPTHSTPVPPVP